MQFCHFCCEIHLFVLFERSFKERSRFTLNVFQGVFKFWGKLSIVTFIMALNSCQNDNTNETFNIVQNTYVPEIGLIIVSHEVAEIEK